MKIGYTYIERSPTGFIQNTTFDHFDSLKECEEAAQQIANSATPDIELTQVVYCNYDDETCEPQMIPVLKTFHRNEMK